MNFPTLLAIFSLATLLHGAIFAAPPKPIEKPLPIDDVTLLKGPFKEHRDLDLKVLLDMSPDRYLALFRKEAGLKPKAEPYGGWERMGVAGQTGGHYLTALCLMWKDTGNPELKRRIDYMVDELAACQIAFGDGYVAAIPGGHQIFLDVKAGKPLRGWVPWYTMHKLLAGLRDATLLAGNPKAREVWIKLADFCCGVIAPLSDEQMQNMLKIEQGGMPEVMADLYALTSNTKYLDAAERFCHRALLDPMSEGRDMLDGWHANTQIPKVIGFMRIYQLTGEERYHKAAQFFWSTVTGNRTWVQGGNSDHEHFFPKADTARHVESMQTAETCNVYNMLRLTRELYRWEPKSAYLDYYERALYNQILGGQEPKKGMFTYFQPFKPGHFRIYSDPVNSGWCCLGTGMENPARYTEATYWSNTDGVTVGLYQPSTARWTEKGVTLRLDTRFPAEPSADITVNCSAPSPFALRLRAPGWLAGPMEATLNGQPIAAKAKNGYLTITRAWKSGDKVHVTLPMRLSVVTAPDDPGHVAFLYGPIVLCGDFGTKGLEKVDYWQTCQGAYSFMTDPAIPPLVAATPEALLARIRPVNGKPLTFTLDAQGTEGTVTLSPYSEMHYQRFVTYWNFFTPADWAKNKAAFEAKVASRKKLDAQTLAIVHPGDQQDEVDFKLQSQASNTGVRALQDSRRWRDAKGWFSYELPTRSSETPLTLRATYWSGDDNRSFRILVNGTEIAHETRTAEKQKRYEGKDYPIPAELTRGKTTLTVRFEAAPGSITSALFELRLMQAMP